MYDHIVRDPIPGSVYVLPVGASINAANPDVSKHPYFDANTTAYVMYKLNERRTRATRVLTSFGTMPWHVGTVLTLVHDQTGAVLGEYLVVGVKDFTTAEQAGDIPDLAIKQAVLK